MARERERGGGRASAVTLEAASRNHNLTCRPSHHLHMAPPTVYPLSSRMNEELCLAVMGGSCRNRGCAERETLLNSNL